MTRTTTDERQWTLKALTPIWTGDAQRRGDRLKPTGLMGSLRWWFEVLVRGLGGAACDPTVPEVRCPDKGKKPGDRGHHCVVCELFGCTGWARKFRLTVLGQDGQVIQNQIERGQTFVLCFIPLRPIREEEWCLLHATLRLIADYGALGGKTVLKPSDEPARGNADHHQDFGLVEIIKSPACVECTHQQARKYVQGTAWRKAPHSYRDRQRNEHDFSWASLQNFWCVKGRYLARVSTTESTFNRVVGRKEDKSIKEKKGKRVIRWSDLFDEQKDRSGQEERREEISRWLAGRQQESKKVFSFKHPKEKGRTFGFVKPGLISFDEMKSLLEDAWGSDFDNKTPFQRGCQILPKLFR